MCTNDVKSSFLCACIQMKAVESLRPSSHCFVEYGGTQGRAELEPHGSNERRCFEIYDFFFEENAFAFIF